MAEILSTGDKQRLVCANFDFGLLRLDFKEFGRSIFLNSRDLKVTRQIDREKIIENLVMCIWMAKIYFTQTLERSSREDAADNFD